MFRRRFFWASLVSMGVLQVLQARPLLEYATYLGGRNGDQARAAAIDAEGYVYIAGLTGSPDLPVTPGSYSHDSSRSLFVAKLSPDGSRLEYLTYFGGRMAGSEFVQGMAVDREGCVYLAGNTERSDFPTTPGAYDRSYNGSSNQWHGDGFVAKLSADGSELVYATFLGGSGAEVLGKVAVDDEGCAYACFMTSSADFPTTDNAFDRIYNGGAGSFPDSVVVKLSADGSELLYATYLGGRVGEDSISAVAVDPAGCIYVSGTTSSPDFPVTDQAYDRDYGGGDSDIFVAKLDPSGSELVYSTFLGGSDYDGWPEMTLDANQRVVLAGQTRSADLPVTTRTLDPGQDSDQNICLAVLSSDGASLEHASLLGGSGSDSPGGIGLDSDMNIVVAGSTESTDFPMTSDAFQATYRSSSDAFLCRVSATLDELSYSTFLGGRGQEATMELAIDADDNAAIVGLTGSTDFPTTRQAFDRDYNGPANPGQWVGDAFIAKFAMKVRVEDGPVHNLNQGYRYDHIRHAVEGAGDGDEITVAPGVYRETVALLEKDIVLRSLDPNDPLHIGGTIIQGDLTLPVLTLEDNTVLCEIAGFTLRAGSVGVAGSGTNAVLRNCRIMDNATHGLELSEASSPHLLSCLITGNGQAGITMRATAGRRIATCEPMIENCVIVQNGQGALDGGEPVIVDSIMD